MTKGELTGVTFALYKIAKVEEKINDVLVWDAMGPDGIDYVNCLHEAMSELSHRISDDLDHIIKLKRETES